MCLCNFSQLCATPSLVFKSTKEMKTDVCVPCSSLRVFFTVSALW